MPSPPGAALFPLFPRSPLLCQGYTFLSVNPQRWVGLPRANLEKGHAFHSAPLWPDLAHSFLVLSRWIKTKMSAPSIAQERPLPTFNALFSIPVLGFTSCPPHASFCLSHFPLTPSPLVQVICRCLWLYFSFLLPLSFCFPTLFLQT